MQMSQASYPISIHVELPKRPVKPDLSSAAIRLADISKQYQEGEATRIILNGVDLDIRRGEFIVLLGHSGSGKSTLLNLIGGLDQPTAGHIYVHDVAITTLSERKRTLFRRDALGFIFQFFNLIPTLTVLENITLPQELAGQPLQRVRPLALKLLEEVGLADRAQTYPDKLSGGQQQRVAIARALVHNPLVVLADEPTGNLDDETGQRVLQLLLSLTRDAHRTLVMATHNPDIAMLADRVFQLHEGQLVATKASISASATEVGV